MPHGVPRKKQSFPQTVAEVTNIEERKYRYPYFINTHVKR